MHIRFKHLFKQTGIGLLELMLSLVIISVLLVSVTLYYQNTRKSEQINQAVMLIQQVINASEDWVATHGTYKDISIHELVKRGKLAEAFCGNADCNTNTINPWGGSILLQPSNDDKTIDITMDKLPTEGACQQVRQLMRHTLAPEGGQCATPEQYSGTYPSVNQ